MRYVLTALALLALVVLSVAPALAQQTHDPSSIDSATSRSVAGSDNATDLQNVSDQGMKITPDGGEDADKHPR